MIVIEFAHCRVALRGSVALPFAAGNWKEDVDTPLREWEDIRDWTWRRRRGRPSSGARERVGQMNRQAAQRRTHHLPGQRFAGRRSGVDFDQQLQSVEEWLRIGATDE